MKNNVSALNECYKMFEKLGYHIDRGTLNEAPEGDQREFYSNFYGEENQNAQPSDSNRTNAQPSDSNRINAQPNNSNHTTDNINNIDSEDDSVLGENLEICVADADAVSYDEGSHTFTIPMLDMRNQDKYVAIVQCPAPAHWSLAFNIYKNDDMTHPVDIEEDSPNDIYIDMYNYLADWLEEKELIVLTNENSREHTQFVPTALINNDTSFTYANVDAQASNVTYDTSNGTFSNIVIFNPHTQQKYLVDVYCPDKGGEFNVSLGITTLDGEDVIQDRPETYGEDYNIYVNVYEIVTDFLANNGYIEFDGENEEYVPTDTYKQTNVIEYDNEIEESIVRSVMKQLIKESKYAKHKI